MVLVSGLIGLLMDTVMVYTDIDLEYHSHLSTTLKSYIKLTNNPYTCYEKRSVLKGLFI